MDISTIAIACDHAGFPLKERIVYFLQKRGIEVVDFGTNSAQSVDYPDFVHPAATAVENGEVDMGIIFCGSGNGVAMTANKHQGIRAALCWNVEVAELARGHNDANMLALPVRILSPDEALAIVEAFLDTEFEGGRHARRVEKIPLPG